MTGLIPGDDSDPMIPPAQQKRALKIINDVNKHVKIMRRFDGRINNLRLFEDFVHLQGHVLTQSRVEYSDHPLIQLLLQRRDRFQQLQKDIDQYQKIIDGFSPVDKSDYIVRVEAITAVAKLKVQQSKELEAMEISLTNIRKEMTIHLHTCQKFVTDMVKISQHERLLAKKLGGTTEDLSDEFIDAKLAE
jgi:hypothetical protein